MPWLLNVGYLLVLSMLAPIWLYRRWVLGKRLGDARQKLWGRLPVRESTRPCLWLHAVSVGEVLQLKPVLAVLRQDFPGFEFVITTTTTTGYDVARKHYPEHRVAYFPLDFSWAVARALDTIRPSAVVLVELEIWPNFILAAAQRQIPIVLINGRISERSFRGYRRIRPLMRACLRRIACFAVQNETYAARLRELGADPERIVVTGSIKFDRVETRRDNPRTQEIARGFGLSPSDRVFVAGSTQAPEEQYALDAYLALRERHPQLRLVLVPRHKERFEEAAQLVRSYGLPLLRRSEVAACFAPPTHAGAANPPVLLLDTLGELSACWGLAEIAFVGGSFGRRGGQNMIEPAAYGAAVFFGPHTQNFRDVVALLLESDAARVVQEAAEMQESIGRCLDNPRAAAAVGARAQALVLAQQGATQRTVRLIGSALAAASIASRAA